MDLAAAAVADVILEPVQPHLVVAAAQPLSVLSALRFGIGQASIMQMAALEQPV
jgi:hypothetical protein